MKWNELRKIAKAKGWRFLRHGGGHDVYCHPNVREPIIMGRHGSEEIRSGTLCKLRKQIGF